ncbi:MAG: response regulator [Anaerolineae bacterium]|nr:response regulator [Anaerolineae bacterium]
MGTILYVEDHPPAQLLMQAIIAEMTAHQVHIASTGEAAQALAASLAPDLYIVDLDLPDMDGLTLAQALKVIHAAPVVLVSAYAETVKDSTFQTIVSAYLAKPLDPADVARIIERTLA